jgi:hypothetical protein
MKIGTRIERVRNYERAVRNDDQLVIDFRVILLNETFFGAPHVITRYERRWSAVDLQSADWQSLARYKAPGVIPGRAGHARIELGSKPETATPPFEEIPILPEPFRKLGENERNFDYRQGLRDAAGSNRLSVCCSGPPGDPLDVLGRRELIVLSQDGELDGQFRFTVVQIPELRYRTWWAIPTRIALLPMTLAADVVTLPAQFVILVGMRQ